MEQQTVRKAYQYRLMPTSAQERALETVMLRCRMLYNCAVAQRKTWWGRGHGKGATYYSQATELPDLKVACPEYGAVHSQVLQEVLRRVDTTSQAFCRRVANGEPPGYPRFQGQNRQHAFTQPQYGTGAVLDDGVLDGGVLDDGVLDGGVLSLSKIGHIPVRLHRPLRGIPKTVTISREADGW